MRIAIIGAGVAGLTTAVVLAEAGHSVRIVAGRRTPTTTSDVAAAFWYPFHAVDYKREWATVTLARLVALAKSEGAGVHVVRAREFFQEEIGVQDLGENDYWWTALSAVKVRPIQSNDATIPDGFQAGIRFEVPVVHMPTYLATLESVLRTAGVEIESRWLVSIDDLLPETDIVVNCSGLGARELVPDNRMTPLRGDLVMIEPCGIEELTFVWGGDYERTPMYIVPRRGVDVVLGGTLIEGEESTEVDGMLREQIVAVCSRFAPEVRTAKVVRDAVGLRPIRSNGVRLELDYGGRVVHNYGHGGSGVTLSYGCALDVLRLIQSL